MCEIPHKSNQMEPIGNPESSEVTVVWHFVHEHISITMKIKQIKSITYSVDSAIAVHNSKDGKFNCLAVIFEVLFFL